AQAGIKRVVSASSINALGFNYGVKSFPIRYFPIDEEHPTYTTDPYSFSKQVLEEVARYFWRREHISGVCLRFPAVYRPDAEHWSRWREMLLRRREAFAAIEAMPKEERQARIHAFKEHHEAMRAERFHERPWQEQRKRFERMWREGPPPPEVVVGWGWTDFWTLLHVLDAVQAIEKGLTADYEGAHVLFVMDSHNAVGVPSEKLAATYFPEVTQRKRPLIGAESLVSIDRARALLGFEPEHSLADLWRGEDSRTE
ncbi:MAG TPA: NAD(P)-dependent oxidoreductase, partial [Chloroflexi bacterium]|nr:NAD(P)-dependent oxidoreductase [Chloroflexota bacterium]